MGTIHVLGQIRGALRNLNPRDVRELAAKRFKIGLLASGEEGYKNVLRFLLPDGISSQKEEEARSHLIRVAEEADFDRCDFGLAEPHLARPPHFYPCGPEAIDSFLEEQKDLWIPVARHFLPFRAPVVQRLIRKISQENALFSIATAIPNIAPILDLPWAAGEFASDAAVLTMNQIRLAFLIAAASDSPVGYMEQRGQIASIVTSAFGWRALARELVSKIPFGGGLLPKGLVAFAGTYVIGLSLERYQRLGRGLTAEEKREQYARAYERGRAFVEQTVGRLGKARKMEIP